MTNTTAIIKIGADKKIRQVHVLVPSSISVRSGLDINKIIDLLNKYRLMFNSSDYDIRFHLNHTGGLGKDIINWAWDHNIVVYNGTADAYSADDIIIIDHPRAVAFTRIATKRANHLKIKAKYIRLGRESKVPVAM